MKPTTTGNHAQATPTAAPHEVLNTTTQPRKQLPGTSHPERIQSPAKSIDLAIRLVLIESSLTQARNHLLSGSLTRSLGQTLAASRHLKQACTEATSTVDAD